MSAFLTQRSAATYGFVASALVSLCGLLFVALDATASESAVGVVDEVHCSFGDDGTSLWIHYRRALEDPSEDVVNFGTDTTYGTGTVTATEPEIVPVDTSGVFREAQLTGLDPGQTIHYKIGLAGEDNTCKTPPTDDFRWADMGDVGTTLCSPWVATTHAQIAARNPDFVTLGGDISYANQCGFEAVHQYYVDQEVWSRKAAFQPVWGNHEYGAPGAEAPSGTPRDSLANYKGRSYVSNPQTVPNDTSSQLSAPGCPALSGGSTNSCQGEDWGWFDVSGVRFISYPEPWTGALPNWRTKADQLMAQAQSDPSIDFIVTYGHRPAYSSQAKNSALTAVRDAINALGDKYSPTAMQGGKYVLNVAHHVHGEEAFTAQHGVVHLTNGGGGEGSTNLGAPAPGSVYNNVHPGYLIADYSAAAHQLAVRLECGPAYVPRPGEPCDLGSTLYHVTFTAQSSPPPPLEYLPNRSVESDGTGYLGLYSAKDEVTWSDEYAYDGQHSIKVRNTASTAQNAGLNQKPVAMTSTTAGTTYTGSVFVRATQPGQVAALTLSECRADGTCGVGAKTVTLKLPNTTDWHQITVTYTAASNGGQLKYLVFAKQLPPARYLYADMFSLTKPG